MTSKLASLYNVSVRIGLIADTHIDSPSKKLPPQVSDAFKGVDLILHAGDIWIPSVLDELESIAPVMATWGDDDRETDLAFDDRMIKGHAISLNGINLWLVHEKPRYGLIDLKGELSHLPDSETPPDVVVFGHDHQAAIQRYKGLLLVSPGSPTLPNYILTLGTVALLTIEHDKIEACVVPLE